MLDGNVKGLNWLLDIWGRFLCAVSPDRVNVVEHVKIKFRNFKVTLQLYFTVKRDFILKYLRNRKYKDQCMALVCTHNFPSAFLC